MRRGARLKDVQNFIAVEPGRANIKAMYIKPSDSPLPTFKSDVNTRVALAICTAGIALFGICSCIYDYLFAASAM